MTEQNVKEPSIVDALLPVFALIIMLFLSVRFFGSDSSYGANQIALLLAGCVAALVGIKNGYSWKSIEKGIVKGISTALGAILILLAVGSLIGTWILSGTVPTMIYFGLEVLHPSTFYVASSFICALVSISIGSSWTTAGTIGIALIGIASGLGLSLEITAGAIISGAYFGDKMSPLSDTTNLAPAVAGTELFTHIRHMAWTTFPSFGIAIILFAIIGAFDSPQPNADLTLKSTLTVLSEHFNITVWSMVPLVVVLFLAFKRFPAFPTIMIGALVGGVFAVILQSDVLIKYVGKDRYSCSTSVDDVECKINHVKLNQKSGQISVQLSDKGESKEVLFLKTVEEPLKGEHAAIFEKQPITVDIDEHFKAMTYLRGVWQALFAGFSLSTGNSSVDDLLNRGGMVTMLNTVWLILCALTFGAVLEHTRLLERLVLSMLQMVHGTGSLITTIILTCIGTNIIAGDQYISIVLPGRMYRLEFEKRKLDPKNLSRVLEDSGTITSPLIPWNTCGAYMSSTLGVATWAYLPYAFFNLVNPLVSMLYGLYNFKIEPLQETSETA